jgi:hypothetical protein
MHGGDDAAVVVVVLVLVRSSFGSHQKTLMGDDKIVDFRPGVRPNFCKIEVARIREFVTTRISYEATIQ